MKLTERERSDFNTALNEATIVDVAVDQAARRISVTLAVLALPHDRDLPPSDPRLRIVLAPVGRVAAALLHGDPSGHSARTERFELDQLPEIVRGFRQAPIYGWDFLDIPAEDPRAALPSDLSLDWRSGPGGLAHRLDLFQERSSPQEPDLDFWIWFDELAIFGPDGEPIALSEFVAGGVRWWTGFYDGDDRTRGPMPATFEPLPDDPTQ